MEADKLLEEKKRLENVFKEMSKKSERERKEDEMKLLHEYNSVKDATQVSY